ncbi:FtsK/SpoIIIE domain-containing protein, partial [Ureaplasma diversum]|uniref:FtsK/SpoIIIE domain-containing protein n=1 Tax=Ureaplasma diversum TaxID=42094 RepID=UPI00056F1736
PILLGSLGNGLFLLNKQDITKPENASFALSLTQSDASFSFSSVWAKNFNKAIGHQQYYYTLPMSFGGVIGFVHVDLYKHSGWIYSVVLTSLLIILILAIVISLNIKTKTTFNLKLKIINYFIKSINKNHNRNLELVDLNDQEDQQVNKEENKQVDDLVDELKQTKEESEIKQNRDVTITNPVQNEVVYEQIEQFNQPVQQQTNNLVTEPALFTSNINSNQSTNQQQLNLNNISQTYSHQTSFDQQEQTKTPTTTKSSFQPKPALVTNNFDFADEVVENKANEEIETDNYKYYPKTSIINELNKDFYHELKLLAADVDKDAQRFFSEQNITFDQATINVLFSSFEIGYEIKENQVSAILARYSESLKEHLNYYTLNQHQDAKLNVFGLGSKLYVQVAFKSLSSSVSLKELLDKIDYNNQLYIGLGKKSNRELIYLNNDYNIIMAQGNNGSGRSKLLSVAIISALYKKSPKELDLYLVSNNTKSLSVIDQLPHIKAVAKADEFEGTISLLRSLNEKTTDVIKRKLEPNNCNDIYQYNEKFPHDQIPQTLIVISEYNDILESSYAQTFKTLIYRLRNNAQIMGFKVLLFSAFSNENTTEFKQIADCLIGLKNNNVNESYLFLNSTLCTNLVGNGDMVIVVDRDFKNPIRAQVPQIENETYTNIINEIMHCDYNLDVLRNGEKKSIKTKKFFNNLIN